MRTATILQSIVIGMTFMLLLVIQQEAKGQNWGWGNKSGINGEGNIVTQTLDLPTITSLGLGIHGEVYLAQGSRQSISIEAQQNIIDNIKQNVKGRNWNIEFDKNVKNCEPIKIYITMADLDELSIGGSGKILGQSKFSNLNNLELSIGGSGDIILDVEATDIETSIGGSGTIELSGSGESLHISIAGSGDIIAFDLPVKNCEVSTAGSGDSQVNVSNSLEVSAVGSGDVTYIGNPSIEKSVIGSCKIRSKE